LTPRKLGSRGEHQANRDSEFRVTSTVTGSESRASGLIDDQQFRAQIAANQFATIAARCCS